MAISASKRASRPQRLSTLRTGAGVRCRKNCKGSGMGSAILSGRCLSSPGKTRRQATRPPLTPSAIGLPQEEVTMYIHCTYMQLRLLGTPLRTVAGPLLIYPYTTTYSCWRPRLHLPCTWRLRDGASLLALILRYCQLSAAVKQQIYVGNHHHHHHHQQHMLVDKKTPFL